LHVPVAGRSGQGDFHRALSAGYDGCAGARCQRPGQRVGEGLGRALVGPVAEGRGEAAREADGDGAGLTLAGRVVARDGDLAGRGVPVVLGVGVGLGVGPAEFPAADERAGCGVGERVAMVGGVVGGAGVGASDGTAAVALDLLRDGRVAVGVATPGCVRAVGWVVGVGVAGVPGVGASAGPVGGESPPESRVVTAPPATPTPSASKPARGGSSQRRGRGSVTTGEATGGRSRWAACENHGVPSPARRVLATRLLGAGTTAVLAAGVVTAATMSSRAASVGLAADARAAVGGARPGAPAAAARPAARPPAAAQLAAAPPAAAQPGAAQPAADRGSAPGAAAGPLYPLPARPVSPTGCPPRPAPPGYGVIPRPPRPRVAEARVPAPMAQPLRAVDTSAVDGTGIWVTVFRGGSIDAAGIVDHAVKAHLRSIWVRTGSSREGLFGTDVLRALLPPAHRAGLRVIAWDFPTLSDPVADAARMVATLRLTVGAEQVDGVSPDVETSSEGVFLTPRRVASYFSRISAQAGSRPVIATVLRPTDYWWSGNYPYRAEAPFVDAFAPMVYWGCQEPGVATAQAVDRLRTLGKPVHTVGQAYDMGTYGRRGLPSPQEMWRFLDVSRRRGAVGASLYLYAEMRGPNWRAVGAYPWR